MSGDSFEARALQLAFDLTVHNTYEGRVGQGYNEARAHDIRRLYNLLCGREAGDHGHGPAKKSEARRKKAEAPIPALPDAGALGRS
ncbi:hypothetical protein SAMN04488058_10758 [Deinococcus reticulitermitis]|uniref:Uncharacterized protein n=1 Tax=Deinococcus reticulitermitis TaxID=856736 RepID=A0A1H6YPU2_9DEIO|nr:hypothetical protein [Deinococcus reticulitermitis]SEJ38735.1 hypothetical protein SAMN04488058_10758 [Deinococcus reticulitermitis]